MKSDNDKQLIEKMKVDNFNLHIPNTTGSVLSGYLSEKYSSFISNMIVFHGPHDFPKIRIKNCKEYFNSTTVNKYSYCVGHLPFSIAKDFFKISQIFTVLRHPIDRWLSNFLYSRVNTNNKLWNEKKVKDAINHIKLIRSQEENSLVDFNDNIIVRMFCDDYLFANQQINIKNFESAFKNLHKMQIILMNAKEDDLFFDKEILSHKKSPFSALISEELLEMAHSLNKYDMEIWKYIKKYKIYKDNHEDLEFDVSETKYVRRIDHLDYKGDHRKEEYEIYPNGRPELIDLENTFNIYKNKSNNLNFPKIKKILSKITLPLLNIKSKFDLIRKSDQDDFIRKVFFLSAVTDTGFNINKNINEVIKYLILNKFQSKPSKLKISKNGEILLKTSKSVDLGAKKIKVKNCRIYFYIEKNNFDDRIFELKVN